VGDSPQRPHTPVHDDNAKQSTRTADSKVEGRSTHAGRANDRLPELRPQRRRGLLGEQPQPPRRHCATRLPALLPEGPGRIV